MAQAKFVPLLTTTTGLNNALDPVRIEYDLKTGVTELSQAINVDIDNSGRVNRRLGRTIKNVLPARCGFASGEVCLFVSGATLRIMRPDYATAVLRTDLTVGARMRYRLIAGRIYYTNGVQKGYVFKEQNYTWGKGDFISPGNPNTVFSNPPTGHIVSWFAGRALIARENAIFASEPSFYGVFDLHGGARLVPDHITMLQPTAQGLWVGTTTQVMFYRGTKWEELRREPKASYGVLEGSDAECPGEKLGAPDKAILFTTARGICVGSESGEFVNLTDKKLIFPAGRYASGTIAGDRYLVLIEP
jgi:hypothetical protein